MKIDQKTIEQLAKLSKLEFDEEVSKKFAHDLEGILDYVKQLEKVEFDDAKEVFSVNNLQNIRREDTAYGVEDDVKKTITENVTDSEDDYIKVKRVL